MTNQQIADHLVVQVGTVKNHVHSILDKLEKQTREEAADYLRSLPPGLVDGGYPSETTPVLTSNHSSSGDNPG
jgi:hypothetical protein